MPSTKVGVGPKVHTELVSSGVMELVPLQIDESPLRTIMGGGTAVPLGDAKV